jgi:hypothetical protein
MFRKRDYLGEPTLRLGLAARVFVAEELVADGVEEVVEDIIVKSKLTFNLNVKELESWR